MKKLFFSAIPICLVSYVLFGISVAILSTRPRQDTYYDTFDTETEYVECQYIDETVNGTGAWTLTEVMPNVRLRTSGVGAYVIQSADEFIHLRVNSSSKVTVKASSEYDTLDLEIHPPEITFGDIIDFGQILWNEDIFHGSQSAEVVIAFPKLIYNSLEIQHGSGTLMVDGFNASRNDIDIGSGRFEFRKSDQYISNNFKVNLGSGSAVIGNMQTKAYYINIGSGSFNFYGLSGNGNIDMGSGKGSIAYDRDASVYSGGLDMGSGNLSMYFPDEYGFALEMDFGSGSVDVNAYGIKKTYNDYDYIDLGNADGSGSRFDIDMGSGKVYVRNTSAYTVPLMFEGRPDNVEELGMIKGIVIDGDGAYVTEFSTSSSDNHNEDNSFQQDAAAVSGNASSSSSVAVTVISSEPSTPEVTSAPEAPSAPEVPEAPSAPDAPSAPEAPDAPSAPEAPDAPSAPEAAA